MDHFQPIPPGSRVTREYVERLQNMAQQGGKGLSSIPFGGSGVIESFSGPLLALDPEVWLFAKILGKRHTVVIDTPGAGKFRFPRCAVNAEVTVIAGGGDGDFGSGGLPGGGGGGGGASTTDYGTPGEGAFNYFVGGASVATWFYDQTKHIATQGRDANGTLGGLGGNTGGGRGDVVLFGGRGANARGDVPAAGRGGGGGGAAGTDQSGAAAAAVLPPYGNPGLGGVDYGGDGGAGGATGVVGSDGQNYGGGGGGGGVGAGKGHGKGGAIVIVYDLLTDHADRASDDPVAYGWREVVPDAEGHWIRAVPGLWGKGLADTGSSDFISPAYELNARADVPPGTVVILFRGYQHGGDGMMEPGQEYVFTVGANPDLFLCGYSGSTQVPAGGGGDLYAIVLDSGTTMSVGGRHVYYDAILPDPQWDPAALDFQRTSFTKIWLIDRIRSPLAPGDVVKVHQVGTWNPNDDDQFRQSDPRALFGSEHHGEYNLRILSSYPVLSGGVYYSAARREYQDRADHTIKTRDGFVWVKDWFNHPQAFQAGNKVRGYVVDEISLLGGPKLCVLEAFASGVMDLVRCMLNGVQGRKGGLMLIGDRLVWRNDDCTEQTSVAGVCGDPP